MTVDEYLKTKTGEDAKFWMDWIGKNIAEWTDEETKRTDCDCWMEDLASTVWAMIEPMPCYDWSVQDENIVTASIVGLILSMWSCRVINAKSHDPRRPVETRKEMLQKLSLYQTMLNQAMYNDSQDKVYFPLQEWESPYVDE
jgi:hypothetical protein